MNLIDSPHRKRGYTRQQRREWRVRADNPKPSSALENVFLDDWREAGGDDERLRVAIDQVASLTDTSALTLHSLLC